MKAQSVCFLGGVLSVLAACGALGGCVLDDDGDDDVHDAATTSASAPSELETLIGHVGSRNRLPNHAPVPDATGIFTTVSTQGFIDLDNEFFQDLGSNGRRCVSCHVPSVGWTITPPQLRLVFELTRGGLRDDAFGLGAVFRTVDGSNSPTADVSSLSARRKAYSMLLEHGLVRVGLPVPENAEFELVAVDDPHDFASAAELSLFRRPLPTTNLKFDSTVMWDGREVVAGTSVASMLASQSSSAVVGHAQGEPLPDGMRRSIVDFSVALASAQVYDRDASWLYDGGGRGGPTNIHAEEFHIGINDNFGDHQTREPFTPIVFTLFDRWSNARGRHAEARRAVARGQALFNLHPITISGVAGINDEEAFGNPDRVVGTCTTCHDTPNGGNHSVVAPLDIGLVDASRRMPGMPLYTLRNKATGEVRQVTDPGRAMISGTWKHIGRFKGPMLRNLVPRAPYFHNGFAASLDEAVEFYNDRFDIGFTRQEKSDLVAFLQSL